MKSWYGGIFVVCLWMVVRNAMATGTTCACGQAKQGRMIGGKAALSNQYPWAAMLVTRTELKHFCGATIVSKTVAFTGTHCTKAAAGISLSLIAGATDVSQIKQGQIVQVDKIIEHEKYTSPVDEPGKTVNDIAILFLSPGLQFNANVGPVCLPNGKMNLENKWIKIVGWGRTTENSELSKNLMQADMQVKPFSYCKTKESLQEPQTQICVETPGKSACLGDSGGPVVYLDPEINRYTLVGIVSFNTHCKTNEPTVATEISAFLPWIKSKINSLGCHKIKKSGHKVRMGGKKTGAKKKKGGGNRKKGGANKKKGGGNGKKNGGKNAVKPKINQKKTNQ